MQNLLKDLKELLAKDERFTAEGELLKNKIVESALKLDEKLIKLLLTHKKLEKHFFTKIGEALIFDKDKFVKFVSNKQFLPDSYTAFKNKIGLTEGDEYISEKKDVVLSWPYKDCVLEGGQTKEDAKRDEVFWNQTLAPDEIDRLLDPKVFTNAKRVDKNGEHNFDKFNRREDGTISDNLIIKGNNLLALHSLKKEFAGKVKLIYIDPPYNTGNDSFGYNDKFNHSTWLTFMRNRLKIAKELLKDSGAIIISCDDAEQAYLKVLLDEIFERNNFLVNGVVNRPSEIASNYTISKHEYFIIYSKSFANFTLEGEERFTISRGTVGNQDQTMPTITFPSGLKCNGVKDGIYTETRKIEGSYENIENLDPIIVENGFLKKEVRLKARWRSSNDMRHFFNNNCTPTIAKINGIIEEIYFEGDRFIPQIKKRIVEKIPSLILDNKRGSKDLDELELKGKFKYPKSVDYIKKLIGFITSKDDIILDFFGGSGTTAQAVMELNEIDKGNRQFILLEQLDEHMQTCLVRNKSVSKNSKKQDFIYCEVKELNEEFVQKIKNAKDSKELLKIWEKMQKGAFLSWRLDFDKLEKHAKEFENLSLENQKKFLLEVLDQNQLYINYSEIEDEMYGVSEEDKELNKKFYENS